MNPLGFECADPENPSKKEIFAGLMSLLKISKIKMETSSLEESVGNVQEATENGPENVTTKQQAVLVNQLDLEMQVHSDGRKADIAIKSVNIQHFGQQKSSQIKPISLEQNTRTKQNIDSKKKLLLTRFCQHFGPGGPGENTNQLFKTNMNGSVDMEDWDGLKFRREQRGQPHYEHDFWKPGNQYDNLLCVF
jgi:hypothetical protein